MSFFHGFYFQFWFLLHLTKVNHVTLSRESTGWSSQREPALIFVCVWNSYETYREAVKIFMRISHYSDEFILESWCIFCFHSQILKNLFFSWEFLATKKCTCSLCLSVYTLYSECSFRFTHNRDYKCVMTNLFHLNMNNHALQSSYFFRLFIGIFFFTLSTSLSHTHTHIVVFCFWIFIVMLRRYVNEFTHRRVAMMNETFLEWITLWWPAIAPVMNLNEMSVVCY